VAQREECLCLLQFDSFQEKHLLLLVDLLVSTRVVDEVQLGLDGKNRTAHNTAGLGNSGLEAVIWPVGGTVIPNHLRIVRVEGLHGTGR